MPMHAMIMDDVRSWRDTAGTAGPLVWGAAWERTISLVEPLWSGKERHSTATSESEGAAALAVALYIVASERGIPVGQVTRADVEGLVERPVITDGYSGDTFTGFPHRLPVQWAERLIALGHDLDDEGDPVAACWRRLAHVRPEPPMSIVDRGRDQEASFQRVGPVVTNGILYMLAPIYKDRLQF